MAVWSQPLLTSVSKAGRVDSEYYRPSYLQFDKRLSKIETSPISKYFSISDGNHFGLSKHFSQSEAVSYFRGQDITGFFIENSVPIRIPYQVFQLPFMRRSHFKENDVLLSIVGTIGSVSVVTNQIGEATGSCKIAIIRARGGYHHNTLAAFLLSRYGQFQIHRRVRGAVQTGLILKDIPRIEIPIFHENHEVVISALVEESVQKNRQANDSMKLAQQLLNAELGLDKGKIDLVVNSKANNNQVNLSDVFTANRIDSRCFTQQAVKTAEWLLRNANCSTLRSLLLDAVKGHKQTETDNGSIGYCSIKNISGIEVNSSSKCNPTTGASISTNGDLLLAITGATIGKVGIVERYSSLAFSGDLLRLRPQAGISPYYLILMLNHPLCQAQFARWITGSTNGHFDPRCINRILVPRLENKIEKRIAELVSGSLAQRRESEALLAQAIQQVEQLIEEAIER